jgi:hypothetical protein
LIRARILDPACGFGAFFYLSNLDPENAGWRERQLAKARQLDVRRGAAEQAIEEAFRPDHGD